jgi:hypothetical protein
VSVEPREPVPAAPGAGPRRPLFQHLFVLGRPACGKSEFIDFMRKLPDGERAARFGIGRFEEIDDFPWLWEACVEDEAREARGQPRLVSERTAEGYNITRPKFRGSLVAQFNEQIAARYLSNPSFYEGGTLLIEFARGRDDTFRESLERFERAVLEPAAILFIHVSFEESQRRNTARYRPGSEASTLFHKVPDRDMNGFFRDNDWEEISGGAGEGWLHLSGVRVPFVTMNNEPETKDGVVLGERYGRALLRLLDMLQTRQ